MFHNNWNIIIGFMLLWIKWKPSNIGQPGILFPSPGYLVVPLGLLTNLATRWCHLHCQIVWDYPIGIICLYLHQPESHQLSVRKREESKVADEKQIGCWGWEATLVLTLVVVVVGPRRERLSRVDEPEFREQLVPLLDHQHHTIHQSPTKNSHRWAQQWHVHINKNWTYIWVIFPRTGKMSKICLIFFCFWSFTVTKRFDFFKFSQLFYRDYVRWSLKILSFTLQKNLESRAAPLFLPYWAIFG